MFHVSRSQLRDTFTEEYEKTFLEKGIEPKWNILIVFSDDSDMCSFHFEIVLLPFQFHQ